MPLSPEDRQAFSLKIVTSNVEINGILTAKAQLQSQIGKVQKLDTANKNLFTPINTLINAYHQEIQKLDGNQRTSITEQDILDSAGKKFQNHFFPNDTATNVPSLSSLNNVWPRVKPFALTYAIGKNYTEGYTVIQKEGDLITAALGYITDSTNYSNIQNTTGQHCVSSPTPPTSTIESFAAVQTLKTNLVNTINSLVAFLNAEVASIVTNDADAGRQAQNNAAITNINTVILPALNTWLAYPDFNTSHGQSTCAGFNSYDSNLLAPTKLHSTQLTALQSALTNRQSFVSTRLSQLNTVLGTVVQNITTGEVTSSSGLYGPRYSYLVLRLNALGGSLSQLVGLQTSTSAQDSIILGIKDAKAIYQSVVPTSILKAPASGTDKISLIDTSFLSVGDTVYIMSEGQQELQRAIKDIQGELVTLNEEVPAKYRPEEKARLYKDIT